jgi:hypothetical protein
MPKERSVKERVPSPRRTREKLGEFVAETKEARFAIARKWGFETGYFFKLLSGATPAGPTVVARASLSVSPEQACQLIENYLLDILDQIEFERKRLEKSPRKRGGRFEVKVSVNKPR